MVGRAFLGVLERLRPWRLTAHEIRAEAWALGARHQGEVLAGARAESRAPHLTLRRAILLRAVIRSQGNAPPPDRAEARRAKGES
jgi:hypothetical protein